MTDQDLPELARKRPRSRGPEQLDTFARMLGEGVLDACVLYPRLVRDLLLDVVVTCELYEPLWSAEILEEVQRNLIANGVLSEADAAALISALNDTFPEAMVQGHEPLIEHMTNDLGDRHVLAAAVHAGAAFVITDNDRHFPPASWRDYPLTVMRPDDFLCLCLEENPDVDLAAFIVAQRYMKRGQVESYDGLISRMFRSVPKFATLLLEGREYTEETATDRLAQIDEGRNH